jgi:hypothetical protein
VGANTLITTSNLAEYGKVPNDARDERYAKPLQATAEDVRDQLAPDATVILLGSVATAKYVDPLLRCFADRMYFPTDFIGRGDMSRGGLLLRATADDAELAYEPLRGVVAPAGSRPPKLKPLRSLRDNSERESR